LHPIKLEQIRLLLLDVDGVLTDGSIVYSDGGTETKIFNVRDGLGIRLLLRSGISVGVVTGRRSTALRERCRNLGIDLVFDDVGDKAGRLEEITRQSGIDPGEMAFVGDDLPDLKIMRRVGLPIAVADAHAVVREIAALITTATGGAGAVREVCEAILKARGEWDKIIKDFG